MKSPGKPRYGHQLAELICRRFYKSTENIDLPPKFWNDRRFSKNYRLQIVRANALLKRYTFEAIIAALKSKDGEKIYSLTASWLEPIIATEQVRLERLQEKLEKFADNAATSSFTKEDLPDTIGDSASRPDFKPDKSKSLLDELE